MGDRLHATIQRSGVGVSIKLAGILDEDNHLANLTEKVGKGEAVIELGDIERINSCGARDWVNWIAQLEARGIHAVLVECSPAIVAQLNLVRNFSGGALVKSFYIPYHCPECDEEKVLLVEVAELGPPPHEPPTCRCDECESMMDFDDMPDAYFAFLSAKHHASAKTLEPARAKGSAQTIKARARTSRPVLAVRTTSPSLPSLVRPTSQAVPARPPVVEPRAEAPPAMPPTRAWPSLLAFCVVLVSAIVFLAYLVATM